MKRFVLVASVNSVRSYCAMRYDVPNEAPPVSFEFISGPRRRLIKLEAIMKMLPVAIFNIVTLNLLFNVKYENIMQSFTLRKTRKKFPSG